MVFTEKKIESLVLLLGIMMVMVFLNLQQKGRPTCTSLILAKTKDR